MKILDLIPSTMIRSNKAFQPQIILTTGYFFLKKFKAAYRMSGLWNVASALLSGSGHLGDGCSR